ncbi:MAG: extracellular solute-binding protein [Verrucomicrobiota bacterium]
MKLSTNLLALGVLALMYLASIWHFGALFVTHQPNEEGEARKTIRIAHWQLEPGYREGLQWAIDKYNELPHVKKANVFVEQQGIPQRVYLQFLNVHLIAGTAPDIAVRDNNWQLIKGSAIARFFTPLSGEISLPNKYNAREFLPEDMAPELADFLADSPWMETFIDGMKGGYDGELNDFYAVPVSTWGGQRFFFNMTLVSEAKDVLRRAFAEEPRPEWLTAMLREPGDEDSKGFLPDTPGLRAWLETGEVPQSLGQFLLLCEAVLELAEENGNDALVPVSGSSYSANTPGLYTYAALFLNDWADRVDLDRNLRVDGLESLAAFHDGVWTMDSTEVREAYELMGQFTRYYPPGFLGLDREQAQRRFVTGNAMMVSTGGWDASSIFRSVAKRSEEGRFEIEVVRPPVPAEDERWANYFRFTGSEAEFNAGVPMTINKASPHPEWCIDFLRFVTSFTINEEMNQRTGWASVVVGADPSPEMVPFLPQAEGYPPADSVNVVRGANTIPQIRNVIEGSTKLVLTGEIDFDTFAERSETAINDPVLGTRRQWYETWRKRADRTLPLDQSLNVEAVRQYLLDDKTAETRRTFRLFDVINNDEGYYFRKFWEDRHPGEPFPDR